MATITCVIAATADDATSVPGLTNSSTGLTFGLYGGSYSLYGGLRFPGVALPPAATVTAATITLTRHDNGPVLFSTPGSSGAGAGLLRGVAVANQGPLPADLTSLAVTAASSGISTGATVVIDVQGVVTAIQALSGWASGNAMAFVGDPAGAAGFLEAYDYSSDAAKAAVLSITYDAGGPDVTPPTITSAAAPSVVEGQALSHALTANETVTWSKVGGTDAGAFGLSGSTLSLSAQTYPSGPLTVVVRATDTAGNWTEQTITVSVTAAPPIGFVGAATGANTATLPTHQAGDLILAFAFRDGSNTQPTIPAGWTALQNAAGANTCSHVLASKIAASASESVGTFANATSVVVQVYRPKAGYALAAGAIGSQGGTASSITYPAITLQDVGGVSWAAAFGGHRSTNTALETAPAGMTQRATVVDATDEAAGFDTNGGVTAWSAQSVALGGTASGWRASVAEIKAVAAMTARPTFQAFVLG